MKSRGRNQRFQQRKKGPVKKKKQYSLYTNNKTDHGAGKRKFNGKNDRSNDFKRPKVEPIVKPVQEESSESEPEFEDAMKLLRDSLETVSKQSKAIESSDESVSEDEEDITDNEQDEDDKEVDKDDSVDEIDDEHKDLEEKQPSQDFKNSGNKEEIEEDEKELDLETQKEDDVADLSMDPFSKHIQYEMNESLLNSIQTDTENVKQSTENWPKLGRLLIKIPKVNELEKSSVFSIDKEKIYAPLGEIPKKITLGKDTHETLFIKPQIINNLTKANPNYINRELNPQKNSLPLTELQAELFSILNNYQDLLYPERNFENADELRFVYCLHAMNHILKTRTKVLHHNARLNQKEEVPEEFRDQGLVRPKILIIVPFRDAAYKIINTLSSILFVEDKGNVINKNRFVEDFTGHAIYMPKKNRKPEDYEQTFTGNSNDDFKIGITVTKKSLKLYAEFYSSDIIIASPLGLRTTIGAAGEGERNFDFLASIELLIFDQMEIFLMQNFHHILHILDHMHVLPKDSHGTDFSRVRHWCLNGWAKYYRQTVIISSMVIPEANSVFANYCFNYVGKVTVSNPIANGVIRQVCVALPHIFHKFEAGNLASCMDNRFEFFTKKILPEYRDPLMKQTVIFVPNYYDYVRLRNYFKREDVSFVQICEYSKESKVARARDMFFHGDAHFLLYTERYHFFNRIRLKGIRHVVFYQAPIFPHFYSEVCNFMMEGNMNKKVGSILNMTVSVLYSKYDGHQLAGIVGTETATNMLQSENNVHKILTK